MQAKIGKERELEASLQHLRGKNADISQEVTDTIVNFQFCVFMKVYLFYKL